MKMIRNMDMNSEIFVPHDHDVSTNADYGQWLIELKARYAEAQTRAIVKVNAEKLRWNWQLGRDLVMRRAEERWGSGVVERLSLDLQAAFPGEKGFGTANLWMMKRWYLFYSEKIEQAAQEFGNLSRSGEHFPDIFALIPWWHHVEIIKKCESIDEALFYIHKAIDGTWSRSTLVNYLKADLYHKKGGALTNFADKLPAVQAELAQEITKENYDFGFISLPEGYREKQLEDALAEQMTRFLLELGTGFAFVGRQKEIVISGRSRRVDLLFYHITLRCYVVVELKAVAFEPEFAGKLNYYVAAVDEVFKSDIDNPTIGLLICSDMNRTDVQLAFRGITTPLGVASYDNVQIEEIKRQLPTIEQLRERVRLLEQELKYNSANK